MFSREKRLLSIHLILYNIIIIQAGRTSIYIEGYQSMVMASGLYVVISITWSTLSNKLIQRLKICIQRQNKRHCYAEKNGF